MRDFVKMAFLELKIELSFEGQNENEIAKVKKCNGEVILEIGSTVVVVDQKYYRPTEVDLLIGDATKAKEKLKWVPKYDLKGLIHEMVQSDYRKEKNRKNV